MGIPARIGFQRHGTGWLCEHRRFVQPNGRRSAGVQRTDLGRAWGYGTHGADMTLSWINRLTPFSQFALFSAVKIVCVFAVLMFIVAYAVWVERKLSAAIQDRRGPNRVGIFGLMQPIADAIKAFLKEDFTPAHVRKAYYWLAPAIAMIPSLLTVAIIPFGSQLGRQKMVIADLDVGVLYTFGIVSLAVYGIVLARYAVNSKYPFLGGIRSSAQLISYEIAMGMSVVPIFLIVGGLRLSQVCEYQSGGWV